MGDDIMLGFGGLEDVRFRDTVVPGDRLVIVALKSSCGPARWSAPASNASSAKIWSAKAEIKGIPIPVDALTGRA